MKKDIMMSAGQLRKKRVLRQRLVRAVIQLIFFISMPSAFVAGFSGVKYIFSQIYAGNVLEFNSFLITLTGLCIFTILFGRFFCGYVCAFGSLSDFIYEISGLIQKKVLRRKKQFSFPESWVCVLQKVKYLILTLIVIFCCMGIYERFSGSSPWDVFSMLTVGKTSFSGYTAGIIILIAVSVGMALQERFFCQFLCPMGALFALLPVLPVSELQRNEAGCQRSCSVCRKNCPVHLYLEKDSFRSGECICCGKCAEMCPGENIHSLEGRLSGNELWLVTGKAAMFFIMGTILGLCRFL